LHCWCLSLGISLWESLTIYCKTPATTKHKDLWASREEWALAMVGRVLRPMLKNVTLMLVGLVSPSPQGIAARRAVAGWNWKQQCRHRH
jgi:hypothetical protein